MNIFEQEIRYRLLKILSHESSLSQREMARQMGVSLGKVNFCLSELAKKGLIKVTRFKSARNKIPYTYILTPRGLEEKAGLTVSFLRKKIAEYEEIKRQIKELAEEIETEDLTDITQAETSDAMGHMNYSG
ncbi:MAG: MarR family EPS-associated transcriptional regulator [Deltaproteobacteria bacterium]|nr:MarR family EPS-associated transcriptional regulator [Deltaproteobacteria bacterium]